MEETLRGTIVVFLFIYIEKEENEFLLRTRNKPFCASLLSAPVCTICCVIKNNPAAINFAVGFSISQSKQRKIACIMQTAEE